MREKIINYYTRKKITLALLSLALVTATTSAARYYIKTAREYEEVL